MSEKRELKIDKTIIQGVLIGFIVAIIIVLIIQHFGTFSYTIGIQTRLYNSPFGYVYSYVGEKVVNNYSDLRLSYPIKFGVYLTSAFANFKYILYFWMPISGLYILLKKYNIKLK